MKRILIIGMVVLLGGLMSVMPAVAQPGNGKGQGQPGQSEYGPSPNGQAKGFDRSATSPPYGKAVGHDRGAETAPAETAPADAQGKGQGKGQVEEAPVEGQGKGGPNR